MALYSALIPHVEAIQWFKNGDHPDDHVINNINSGRVVKRHRYYNQDNHRTECSLCKQAYGIHGMLGEFLVCPGDYIEYVRDSKGRTISYKLWERKTFESQYALNTEGKI